MSHMPNITHAPVPHGLHSCRPTSDAVQLRTGARRRRGSRAPAAHTWPRARSTAGSANRPRSRRPASARPRARAPAPPAAWPPCRPASGPPHAWGPSAGASAAARPRQPVTAWRVGNSTVCPHGCMRATARCRHLLRQQSDYRCRIDSIAPGVSTRSASQPNARDAGKQARYGTEARWAGGRTRMASTSSAISTTLYARRRSRELLRPTPRLSSTSTRTGGAPSAPGRSRSSSCGPQQPSVHAKPAPQRAVRLWTVDLASTREHVLRAAARHAAQRHSSSACAASAKCVAAGAGSLQAPEAWLAVKQCPTPWGRWRPQPHRQRHHCCRTCAPAKPHTLSAPIMSTTLGRSSSSASSGSAFALR